MVLDAKFAADQIADAWQRPAVGVEARGQRAFGKQLEQLLPLLVLQPWRSPADGFGFERWQAVAIVLEEFGPLANSGAADADFAGNSSLRELACFEELAGIQPAFLALLAREGSWFPRHRPPFYSVKQFS